MSDAVTLAIRTFLQHGIRIEAIVQPARVGNQPGYRPQGNPRLLNRRGGCSSDVLLAALRTAHSRVAEQTPRSAYPSSYQYDWRDIARLKFQLAGYRRAEFG